MALRITPSGLQSYTKPKPSFYDASTGTLYQQGSGPTSVPTAPSGTIAVGGTSYSGGGGGSAPPGYNSYGDYLADLNKQAQQNQLTQARLQAEAQRQAQAQQQAQLQQTQLLTKQREQIQQQQLQRQQQFSGTIEESFKGIQQAKRFYVQGQEVGKISYSPSGQAVAEVSKSAKIVTPYEETLLEVSKPQRGIDYSRPGKYAGLPGFKKEYEEALKGPGGGISTAEYVRQQSYQPQVTTYENIDTSILQRYDKENNIKNVPKKETIQYTGEKIETGFVAPGLIYTKYEPFKANGKEVPYYGLYVNEPPISGIGEITTRKATIEEIDYFNSQKQNILNAKIKEEPSVKNLFGIPTAITSTQQYQNILYGVETLKGNVETFTTRTGIATSNLLPEYKFGSVTEMVEESQKESKAPEWMKLTKTEKNLIGFSSGVVGGAYEKFRTEPIQTISKFGIGFAGGFLFKGAVAGLGAIPKIGKGVATLFQVGVVGAGTYIGGSYLLGKAGETISAPSYEEKGKVFGETALELGLTGYGFAKGSKAFTQVRGWYNVRGREYLSVKQGVYPSAPTKIQLKLFQKNVYNELGRKPGAFHTTPEKFWTNEITPKAGTSELPGLYASTDISTPFAKISGSGSYKLFPSWKDLITIDGKPGVAFLKPKGFRYTGYKKVTPYQIEEGGKWFEYQFGKEAKLGWADIPGMKAEKEAIFRIGAGSYAFESGKFYTIINDVPVSIDVFGYAKGTGTTAGSKAIANLFGGGYSSYTLPPSYSVLTPQSISIASISKTPKGSIVEVSKVSYTPSSRLSSSYLFTQSSIPSISKVSKVSKGGTSIPSISQISKTSLTSISKVPKSISELYLYRVSKTSTSVSYKSISGTSPTKTSFIKIEIPKYKEPKLSQGLFGVSVRRRGKFRTIGTGLTLTKAMQVGQTKVERELGATFRVEGATGKGLRTPKGFYSKKTKEGLLFIEQRGRRLKRGTLEIPEIQQSKREKKIARRMFSIN